MKTKLLNHSSLEEYIIKLFKHISEDNLSQEVDVAAMVRIKCSNLVISS